MEDAEERDDLVMLKDVSACLYSGILSLLAVMLMVTYTLWASGFVEYKVYPLTTPVGTLVACMHPWTTTDWIITPTPLPGTGTSTRVTLHVGAFDLEPPQNADSTCQAFDSVPTNGCCDFVQVFDGDSIHAPLLGVFCGSAPPGRLVSSGPSLLVRLRLDGQREGSAFTAIYTSTGYANSSQPLPLPSFPLIQCQSGQPLHPPRLQS